MKRCVLRFGPHRFSKHGLTHFDAQETQWTHAETQEAETETQVSTGVSARARANQWIVHVDLDLRLAAVALLVARLEVRETSRKPAVQRVEKKNTPLATAE